MDGTKKAPKEGRTGDAIFRALKYVGGFLLFWLIALLMMGENAGDLETAEGLLLFAFFCSPWIQLVRAPILNRLLQEKSWGVFKRNAILVDWLVSLMTGACLAFPLVNLAIHGGYTGSLLVTREWHGYEYGQLSIGNHEIGIPDYLAALVLAVIIDILVLWAFALFRKPAFKPSLRAALIVNAAIYIPVTLLFIMPYLLRKLGM